MVLLINLSACISYKGIIIFAKRQKSTLKLYVIRNLNIITKLKLFINVTLAQNLLKLELFLVFKTVIYFIYNIFNTI